ncbi:ArsR/SmtB family transcription factor [Novosphingobium cyanobacteriorum]|uniref:Helix-turn-helix domain-containing protein n=1 Tax=Novosphingobium cyanobacteriorum TaxID=3024215 RepID=A0ABT6CNM2_9SPHN|nr:transcriptional regulator [Novosphingobium cyanobacteriorum]MDF8335500.1 helix-turn-helix domain-containing protein [Novosphingobium cyanobacteriorum]
MGKKDSASRSVTRTPKMSSVPEALNSIGITGPVSTKDTFSIEYSDGLLVATVRKSNGVVQTSRRSVDGSFHESTLFDPESVSKDTRNALIKRLAAGRMTQSEIARRTGVSQATVSNVLRK